MTKTFDSIDIFFITMIAIYLFVLLMFLVIFIYNYIILIYDFKKQKKIKSVKKKTTSKKSPSKKATKKKEVKKNQENKYYKTTSKEKIMNIMIFFFVKKGNGHFTYNNIYRGRKMLTLRKERF